MNKKSTLECWEESGLLDGLPEEQKQELALEFEKIAKYLVSLEKKQSINNAALSLIFPIIRRLYVLINKPGKFQFIVDTVDLFWDISERCEKIDIAGLMYSTIDAEKEFCEVYVEYCIYDLKKRFII